MPTPKKPIPRPMPPKAAAAPAPGLPILSRAVNDDRNRSRVLQAVAALTGDELQVIAIVAERLVSPGRLRGRLTVTPNDPRHFGDEALEEAADGLTYVACALLRAARSPKVRP